MTKDFEKYYGEGIKNIKNREIFKNISWKDDKTGRKYYLLGKEITIWDYSLIWNSLEKKRKK
jgi:hypothetical protein